jgi:hypothetical protein
MGYRIVKLGNDAFGSGHSLCGKIQISLVNAEYSPVEETLIFGLVPVFTTSSLLSEYYKTSFRKFVMVKICVSRRAA